MHFYLKVWNDMKHLFISLMIKIPIIINMIIMIVLSCISFYLLDWICYQQLDFKWFFTLTGVTVALLAQIYTKLQDTKFIANATTSELNRIAEIVNIRKQSVIKLIFFHLIFGILNFIVFSINLMGIYQQIIIAIALSFIVLWLISLLFGYLIYEEIADFNADLLKRKLEKEQRLSDIKALSSN